MRVAPTILGLAMACSPAAVDPPAATLTTADATTPVNRDEPEKEPLLAACTAGDRARCLAALGERGVQLPELAAGCVGSRPVHTLVVSDAGLELDEVPRADAAALGEALRMLAIGELTLMLDARKTLGQLRPVLAEIPRLAPPRRLFVGVLAGDGPDVQHVPIADIELQATRPENAPSRTEGAGYLLQHSGEGWDLRDLVEPDTYLPVDHPISGAAVLVAAPDDTLWGTIAGGLVRACGDVRLVEVTKQPPQYTSLVRRTPTEFPSNIDRSEIRRQVRAHRKQVQACHTKGLPDEPKPQGHVVIQADIDATGRVSSTLVVSTTFRNVTISNCLVTEVRSWRFPRPDGGRRIIDIPFELGSK